MSLVGRLATKAHVDSPAYHEQLSFRMPRQLVANYTADVPTGYTAFPVKVLSNTGRGRVLIDVAVPK